MTLSLQLGFFMSLGCPHFFATWSVWHFYCLVGFPLHPGPGEPEASQLLSGHSTRFVWPWPEFPIWADGGEGGRERECRGERETTRDQSPRGRALSSLSFWSLSFHDLFSSRVCNPGLVLSSSLASFTQHRHTDTG